MLPTVSSIPQNIMSSLAKKGKAKKVSIPKIKSTNSSKSLLKGLISNAKSQVKGLSKKAGVKSTLKTIKLAKMPSIQAPKISTALKRGLTRLG